ncbi:SDR family NAD(P)-dependent oxidoreductase [Brachybacterium phenoliresistens]|uniref:SDR family NAD(P)-dependent oxidoreductase n=1 Tax=Brachybacterium phenoliresistens TaxID=396014 RepID=UPI0004AE6A64|nr:SDR family oxidoreductase [Brachybacterium phenoliresistens]
MNTAPTALITGSNRGLGQAIAHALARTGHRLVLAHRPGRDISETMRRVEEAGGEAMPLTIDIADLDGIRHLRAGLEAALRDRWGSAHLDVLVHNAGIGVFGSLEDATPEDFEALIGTNLRGTVFLTQALLPLLEGGGHVIAISTSLTRHVSPATSLYAASKAAVEAFSRSLAGELGPRGIRVNCIAPGPSATDFNSGAMRDSEELRSAIARSTALGRVADPAEIGEAVAALAAPGMRWVTGERLEVSGGAFL